jgi:regulator of protease activity HflC (stomatin/prohibitin superfamily)
VDILNIGDLAKPATVLIEKVSNAVGVLYEPKKIINKAKAEAEAMQIIATANVNASEIEQRACSDSSNKKAVSNRT